MSDRIDRLWRQFATGVCFCVFGLGGLLIPVLALPLNLVFRSVERRERPVKRGIHICFRMFVGLMKSARLLTYDVDGLELLKQPGQLIIANHPTLIDVVFLISFLPRADCIVKSGLLRNPFTRGPVLASCYIVNDDPDAVVLASKSSIDRGNSLIIFPEGTRTSPGQELRLQRGAANIAIRTANNLRPVSIRCTPPTLTKQSKWYNVPDRRFHMSFRVGDPIDVSPYLEGSPTLRSRELTAVITEYFKKEATAYA